MHDKSENFFLSLEWVERNNTLCYLATKTGFIISLGLKLRNKCPGK